MARKDQKGQEQEQAQSVEDSQAQKAQAQDPKQDEGGQSPVEQEQGTSVEAGSVDLIANVDVPYKKDDGSYGYARGGESFQTDEESAKELVSENRAFYAKENEDGNLVVDQEKGDQLRADAAVSAAEEAAANADIDSENALRADSSVGNKGAFAAESNDMPGGDAAPEKAGTFVDQGPAVRAQRLGEQHGVTRQV